MAAQFAPGCTLCPPSRACTNASPPPWQYHLPSLPQYPPCSHEPPLATPMAKLSHGGSGFAVEHRTSSPCARTNASPPPCQHHLPSLPQYPPCTHEPLLSTPRAKLSHSGSVCPGVHPMPSLSRSHQRKPPTMAISPSFPSSIPSWLTRAPVSHPHGQTEP